MNRLCQIILVVLLSSQAFASTSAENLLRQIQNDRRVVPTADGFKCAPEVSQLECARMYRDYLTLSALSRPLPPEVESVVVQRGRASLLLMLDEVYNAVWIAKFVQEIETHKEFETFSSIPMADPSATGALKIAGKISETYRRLSPEKTLKAFEERVAFRTKLVAELDRLRTDSIHKAVAAVLQIPPAERDPEEIERRCREDRACRNWNEFSGIFLEQQNTCGRVLSLESAFLSGKVTDDRVGTCWLTLGRKLRDMKAYGFATQAYNLILGEEMPQYRERVRAAHAIPTRVPGAYSSAPTDATRLEYKEKIARFIVPSELIGGNRFFPLWVKQQALRDYVQFFNPERKPWIVDAPTNDFIVDLIADTFLLFVPAMGAQAVVDRYLAGQIVAAAANAGRFGKLRTFIQGAARQVAKSAAGAVTFATAESLLRMPQYGLAAWHDYYQRTFSMFVFFLAGNSVDRVWKLATTNAAMSADLSMLGNQFVQWQSFCIIPYGEAWLLREPSPGRYDDVCLNGLITLIQMRVAGEIAGSAQFVREVNVARSQFERDLNAMQRIRSTFGSAEPPVRAAARKSSTRRGSHERTAQSRRSSIGQYSVDQKSSVETNSFETGRRFADYNQEFEQKLGKALGAMAKTGGHWVDMGAGEGKALLDYYLRNPASQVKLTGVGYELDGGWGGPTGRAVKDSHERFRYIEGWFDPIKAKEIGKADIITDIFGIYSYTKDKSRPALLDLYVEMLRPGGVIFTSLDPLETAALFKRHPELSITHYNVNNSKGNWGYVVIAKPSARHRLGSYPEYRVDDFKPQPLVALGQGTFFKVYEHPNDGRAVIKILRSEYGTNGKGRAYFRSHIEAAQRLEELGVGPRFLGQAKVSGRPAIIQERVTGPTLRSLIRNKHVGPKELDLINEMLNRLDAAQVYVADLKAENIVLGTTLSNPNLRAYLVDGTRLGFVPGSVPLEMENKSAREIFSYLNPQLRNLSGRPKVMARQPARSDDSRRRSTPRRPKRPKLVEASAIPEVGRKILERDGVRATGKKKIVAIKRENDGYLIESVDQTHPIEELKTRGFTEFKEGELYLGELDRPFVFVKDFQLHDGPHPVLLETSAKSGDTTTGSFSNGIFKLDTGTFYLLKKPTDKNVEKDYREFWALADFLNEIVPGKFIKVYEANGKYVEMELADLQASWGHFFKLGRANEWPKDLVERLDQDMGQMEEAGVYIIDANFWNVKRNKMIDLDPMFFAVQSTPKNVEALRRHALNRGAPNLERILRDDSSGLELHQTIREIFRQTASQ
jgi:hypothetical protein